jgi:hypothetical protein
MRSRFNPESRAKPVSVSPIARLSQSGAHGLRPGGIRSAEPSLAGVLA